MSISFRNDLGSTGIRVGAAPLNTPLAAEARPSDSPLYGASIAPNVYAIPAESRPLDTRLPDVRPSDARMIDARLNEIKNGTPPRDLPDVKMDQIRELLFGETQRQSELRISMLEAKVRELEAALQHRMDAMQARVDALAAETRGDRRSTLDELARGISDLGDRVKRIPRD
jgi:hypothetical protein